MIRFRSITKTSNLIEKLGCLMINHHILTPSFVTGKAVEGKKKKNKKIVPVPHHQHIITKTKIKQPRSNLQLLFPHLFFPKQTTKPKSKLSITSPFLINQTDQKQTTKKKKAEKKKKIDDPRNPVKLQEQKIRKSNWQRTENIQQHLLEKERGESSL